MSPLEPFDGIDLVNIGGSPERRPANKIQAPKVDAQEEGRQEIVLPEDIFITDEATRKRVQSGIEQDPEWD